MERELFTELNETEEQSLSGGSYSNSFFSVYQGNNPYYPYYYPYKGYPC